MRVGHLIAGGSCFERTSGRGVEASPGPTLKIVLSPPMEEDMALFTTRQRWLMDQVAKGIVRNDFGSMWSIMRPSRDYPGSQRLPSDRERQSLLAGRFVELQNDGDTRRVRVTDHGKWAMETDDKSRRGEV